MGKDNILERPYPFNKKAKNERIYGYVQILDKNDEEGLGVQISLINESQLKYDTQRLNEGNKEEFDYHMYIYEFIGVSENIEGIVALSQDDFYEIEILDDKHRTDGILAEGTIIYSASPIVRSRKTIKIKDKASEDINKLIKDNFRLNDESVFETKEALNYSILETGLRDMIDRLQYKWNIRIVNVRQGNCIFAYNEESKVKFAFDIGYSVFESIPEAGKYIDKYSSEFTTSDSFVILSHWDLDHILGITFIKRKDIFNCVWVTPEVNNKSSIAAQRLAKYIERMGTLITIDSKLNGQNLLDNPPECFNLWKGKGSVNGSKITQENNRGLIIELSKFEGPNKKYRTVKAKKFLLPGDCSYEAMPDAVRTGRYHYLIAPHHGGEMSAPQFQQADPDDIAIILAGYAKFNKKVNPHPDSEHLKNLINKGYVTMINTRSSGESRRMKVISIKS